MQTKARLVADFQPAVHSVSHIGQPSAIFQGDAGWLADEVFDHGHGGKRHRGVLPKWCASAGMEDDRFAGGISGMRDLDASRQATDPFDIRL